MPKYTLNNTADAAALVLPYKPRIVLDKGVETEVSQEAHEVLVGHKIIGPLIASGQIKVEGAKPPKAEKTPEELASELQAKADAAAAKKLKAVRDALTKKSIEFADDETLEQLEAKLAEAK
jgi:hypothetical protein